MSATPPTKSRKPRFVRISITLPIPMLQSLDAAVQIKDTDRSKFIRSALREKIKR